MAETSVAPVSKPAPVSSVSSVSAHVEVFFFWFVRTVV
jgi:hypothetical protein